MFMNATVLSADMRSLLVRDAATGGEVLVHYNNARTFSPGDQIIITYSGAMTASIPPQITATSIRRVQSPAPPPAPPTPPAQSAMRRAVVLQVRSNSLLVRDPGNNNRQAIVHYPFAYHFCVGQRLNIFYDSIVLNNPIEINAANIVPIC